MLTDLLTKVTAYANEHYDGHFTVMKFTTNWRVCYGTIESRDEIGFMRSGKTLEEALQNLLDDPIDVYQISEKLKEMYINSDEELDDQLPDWMKE